MEVNGDGNFKFTQPHCDNSNGGDSTTLKIAETGMQLKHNSFNHYAQILICRSTHIDCPLMRLRPN